METSDKYLLSKDDKSTIVPAGWFKQIQEQYFPHGSLRMK
jgi:hypothetical protein